MRFKYEPASEPLHISEHPPTATQVTMQFMKDAQKVVTSHSFGNDLNEPSWGNSPRRQNTSPRGLANRLSPTPNPISI